MKKLKKRLERKICDLLSGIALLCDGRGYFRVSNAYRYLYLNNFFITITKSGQNPYFYSIFLEGYISVDIEFDVFRRDVVFQKAYDIRRIKVSYKLDSIKGLRELIKKLKIGK